MIQEYQRNTSQMPGGKQINRQDMVQAMKGKTLSLPYFSLAEGVPV